MVVSDYTAINEVVKHGFTVNNKHSASIIMNVGKDMDMMAKEYRLYLKEFIGKEK